MTREEFPGKNTAELLTSVVVLDGLQTIQQKAEYAEKVFQDIFQLKGSNLCLKWFISTSTNDPDCLFCSIKQNATEKEIFVCPNAASGSNRLIPARTSELFFDYLIISEESERLKTAFLANMSHEIRTPMNSILGFTELMDDERLSSEDRKKFISIISSNSRQLLTVINDIIDISKIESNQLAVSNATFNLNYLLDKLLLSFIQEKQRLGKDQIELILEKSLKDKDCYVVSDNVRLAQILNNLVGNALKFTAFGYVKFGYQLDKDNILFYVEDTGKGIAADKREIVFQRFRQEEESYTRQFGGTGLGLPIFKGIVELLGGTIWLNSRESNGSTFYFTLPGSILSKQKAQLPVSEHLLPSLDFTGKVVLIAEDVRENFNYIEILLSRTGAEVLYAENGEQAVSICKSRPDINLILMDIQMPLKNGFEATREIREFNTLVSIIGLTAYAYAEDKIRCIAAGCNDFISKPIERDKLLAALKKYV